MENKSKETEKGCNHWWRSRKFVQKKSRGACHKPQQRMCSQQILAEKNQCKNIMWTLQFPHFPTAWEEGKRKQEHASELFHRPLRHLSGTALADTTAPLTTLVHHWVACARVPGVPLVAPYKMRGGWLWGKMSAGSADDGDRCPSCVCRVWSWLVLVDIHGALTTAPN